MRKEDEIWLENLKERGHLEDPEADGRIILKQTLKKYKTYMSILLIFRRLTA
jgi:hypothetical protein